MEGSYQSEILVSEMAGVQLPWSGERHVPFKKYVAMDTVIAIKSAMPVKGMGPAVENLIMAFSHNFVHPQVRVAERLAAKEEDGEPTEKRQRQG